MQHRLSDIDEEQRTALCAVCGPVSIRKKGWTAGGAQKWRCVVHGRRWNGARPRHKYVSAKGACCERCGFSPEHSCQLDVHHVDGNRDNNDVSNLQTLCANCHRLVTHTTGGPVVV